MYCCGRGSRLLHLQVARRTSIGELAHEKTRSCHFGFLLCVFALNILSFLVGHIIYHIRMNIKHSCLTQEYESCPQKPHCYFYQGIKGRSCLQCPKGKFGQYSALNEKIYIKQCALLGTGDKKLPLHLLQLEMLRKLQI